MNVYTISNPTHVVCRPPVQLTATFRHVPTEPPPVKSVSNPFAIERPHATVSMMERQGSFRGFQQLNQASPFKRQMSLRIGDLPSTLERQRSQSLEGSDFRLPPAHLKPPGELNRCSNARIHTQSTCVFSAKCQMLAFCSTANFRFSLS
jgi:hypothetical protein